LFGILILIWKLVLKAGSIMSSEKSGGGRWVEAGCRWAPNCPDGLRGCEFGCPVCNGMEVLRRPCPWCKHGMEDKGALEDYLGPYSPNGYLNCCDILHSQGVSGYAGQEMMELGKGACTYSGPCIHLMYCARCDRDVRVEVPLRNLLN